MTSPRGSACCGPAGEITSNFTCWTFVTRLKPWNSEGRQTPNTGSRVSNCILGLKTVAPAYGFDVGNDGVSASDILGQFLEFPAVTFGWPGSMGSGNSRAGYPFEINVDAVSVNVGHVVASEAVPVSALGWGKLRWLQRMDIVVASASLGPPSLGRPSRDVECGDTQVGGVRRARARCVSHVDADVLVNGRRNGHYWCHKRINVGHSTRQGFSGSVTTCPVMSSCLSSRLSICPPPVLSAPGISSFPSLSIPFPPAHSALGCDDVGDRVLSFGAGASVARPCSFVFSVSVDSSGTSFDSLPSAGSYELPSRSVASTCRSVKFIQIKSGNVSARRGRRIVAASVNDPGVALIHQSDKVIFNRQVTVVDLGLVSSNVATHSGLVVGSVSGRQPQQMPSSLYCVLRLRGGASSSSSSDDGAATHFGHDGRVDSVLPDVYGKAAGSGFGGDQRTLNGSCSSASREVSVDVPAREEGYESRVVEERGPHRVEYVFSSFILYPRPGVTRSEARLSSAGGGFTGASKPSGAPGGAKGPVMKPGAERMLMSDEAIGDPPLVTLRDVLPVVDSDYPCVADGGQDGNPCQSTTLTKGIRVVRKQVRHWVVQTDPPPKVPKPCNIKQKRRRQIDIDEGNESSRWFYHPFGKWQRWPLRRMHDYIDFYVRANGPGFREASCGPPLREDWFRGGVKEEPPVRSSAVRSVVVFALGSDGMPECNSVEVGPPSIDGTPRHVSVDHGDWERPKSKFDQILVRSYGHPGNGTPLLPSHAPLYNKSVDGAPLNHEPLCFRNIRTGKPAIADRLHFGEVVRFQTRTFVYKVGGRMTNTYGSLVRVWVAIMKERIALHQVALLFLSFQVIAA